jgi:hypothetical protein
MAAIFMASLINLELPRGVPALVAITCGFRFIPAGFSDVKPATVPI